MYSFIPELKIHKTWKIRQNWEPHVRDFATDKTPGLERLNLPTDQPSEVFKTDHEKYEEILNLICQKITDWMELYVKTFPLTEENTPAESH